MWPSGWAAGGVSGMGRGLPRAWRLRVGLVGWLAARPARIWQANTFVSCMDTLASADIGDQVIDAAAHDFAAVAPLERNADLMDDASLQQARVCRRRVTKARASISPRGLIDRQPAAVLDPFFLRQFRAEFHEHGGHQLVEPTVEAAHRPAEIVFRHAERAGHNRVLRLSAYAQSDCPGLPR